MAIYIGDTEIENLEDLSVGLDNDICVYNRGDLIWPFRWVERESGITSRLSTVSYGNNIYVAAGDDGSILTSTDSITWVNRSLADTSILFIGSIFANGIFVLVGENGRIFTSPDGITWTDRSVIHTGIITDITYANGMFITVGIPGVGYYKSSNFISTDGIDWYNYGDGYHETISFRGITFDGNSFLAAGTDVMGQEGVLRQSPNGYSWITVSTGLSDGSFMNIYYNTDNLTYYLLGGGHGSDDAGHFYTSKNMVSWTRRESGSVHWLYDIAGYGNNIIAVGQDGNSIVQLQDSFSAPKRYYNNDLLGITCNDGNFVAVGRNGMIQTFGRFIK